ncbi:unnamed protein product [Cunninghamella echinulata]
MDAFGIVTGLFGVAAGANAFIHDKDKFFDGSEVVISNGDMNNESRYVPSVYLFSQDNREFGRKIDKSNVGDNFYYTITVDNNGRRPNIYQVGANKEQREVIDGGDLNSYGRSICITDITLYNKSAKESSYIPIGNVFDLCGLKTGTSQLPEMLNGKKIYKKCAWIGSDYGINNFRVDNEFWQVKDILETTTKEICESVWINTESCYLRVLYSSTKLMRKFFLLTMRL